MRKEKLPELITTKQTGLNNTVCSWISNSFLSTTLCKSVIDTICEHGSRKMCHFTPLLCGVLLFAY